MKLRLSELDVMTFFYVYLFWRLVLRRSLLKFFVVLLVGVFGFGDVVAVATVAQNAKKRKPNIIYILADDLGYGDLGSFGQRFFKTPSLDKMAAEGMRFTDHYSGSTVCGPSRSCLLSGLHTGHTYLRGNGRVAYPYDPEYPLIGSHLQKLGYHTAMIGKSGVACNDQDADRPNRKGFDHFFGYLSHTDAHFHYPTRLWRNGKKVKLEGNTGKKGPVYAEDIIRNEVLNYVEEHKDEPFFLHWAMAVPHAGLNCPADEIAPFLGKFGKEKPYGMKRKTHYAATATPKATYAAMVTRLDRQVGELLKKLKDLGIADDTVVIFSSDNGPHYEGGAHPETFDSNGQLRGGKRSMTEGGIRVPTIVWWPGKVAAGTSSDHVSAFWDFPATAVELAGGKVDFESDGISFLPAMLGKKQKKHEVLYWEFYEGNGSQAVRFGNWKAIRYKIHKESDPPIELYDLSKDIGESNNLAGKYPELVKKAKGYFYSEHKPSEIFRFRKWDPKKHKM